MKIFENSSARGVHLDAYHHAGKNGLTPVYVYVIVVTFTLILLLTTISLYIVRRKTLFKHAQSMFLFSLLCTQFFDNLSILGLNITFIKLGMVPETAFRKYVFIEHLNYACSTFDLIVATTTVALAMDRFLAIYLNLRYVEIFTKRKQRIVSKS